MADAADKKKWAHVYPTVADAFEKVEALKEVEEEKVDRALKADEDFLKESAAQTAKAAINPVQRGTIKFLAGIGKGVGLGWIDTNGDFFKMAVLAYKGFETVRAGKEAYEAVVTAAKLTGRTSLHVVGFYAFLAEVALYAIDVADYAGSEYYKGVKKESVEKYRKEVDSIVLAYSNVDQKLWRELESANRDANALIAQILPKYAGPQGKKLFEAYRAIKPADRSNHPVTFLLKSWFTNDLAAIGEARYRLYSIANTADAFVAQCERVRVNASNRACGFSGYKDFKHPKRAEMIAEMGRGYGSDIETAAHHSRTLETIALTLWTFVGYGLGFSVEQAKDMARIY